MNQGTCPLCGSKNLTFRQNTHDAAAAYFPFTCDDCQTEGEEIFVLVYHETTITKIKET